MAHPTGKSESDTPRLNFDRHLKQDVLEPVVTRYRGKFKRRYFPADAAFANPEVYEF